MINRVRTALPALAAGGALTATLLGAVSSPAQAAPAARPGDSGGEFFTIPAGQSRESYLRDLRERLDRVHIATPGNKKCTGDWDHPVAKVNFQRARGGTLMWSFWLSKRSKARFRPSVTTSMPYAWVNDKAINPPYRAHSESVTYNFHGSMNKYQVKGGGKRTIKTNDKVTFYWVIVSNRDPRKGAYRYLTCKVGPKGSH
ncbi:hypothetical protein [Actinomadura kijaniata]|uniref:hypothetical protein n=1 Tax=Actinomadura kijaniata TaxID=46161 RepID=UPI00082B0085|nr:hypothetical protein [Actinomadura kijaniata]